MQCKSCGAETVEGWGGTPMEFCKECEPNQSGVAVSENLKSGSKDKFHAAIVFNKLLFGIYLLVTLMLLASFFSDGVAESIGSGMTDYDAIKGALIGGLMALLHYVVVLGIKKEKPLAVAFTLLVSFLCLLWFPIGTVVGGVVIYSIVKNWRF
ncbi:hypothetical protein [Alcanivorax sediminis]|uniref:Uncharacterized protein n=1 Tax=Alcanivorax sediminis TaxID=2663008 RepID=A0A6N7LRK4_9GAMM|nr:hypothetical protein [Alcanivorax sediminis]MQX53037.1 hypothetical protein [Alcanivorax sediminis]